MVKLRLQFSTSLQLVCLDIVLVTLVATIAQRYIANGQNLLWYHNSIKDAYHQEEYLCEN